MAHLKILPPPIFNPHFKSGSSCNESRVIQTFAEADIYRFDSYQKMINNVIKQCYFKNSIKIRFEGKGYYLYKNLRNTLAPKFGFAHRIYLYYFLSWVKVLSKTKLLVYDNVKANLLNNAVNLKLLRSRNPFTGRGVRFGRDVRFKKRGKVSSFK